MKKVMVIVGASDGLGKCLRGYFAEDYQVVAVARTESKLKALQAEFGVDYFVCDITNFENVKQCFGDIIKKYKNIDVLINGAGVLVAGELVSNDYDKIEAVLNTNLNGLIYATKAVLPNMLKNGSGVIFNIDSICTDFFRSERSVYYASKYGVDGFTKCLQQEVSKKGIKVVNVRPGTLATNMFKKIGETRDIETCLNPTEVAKVMDYILKLPKDVTIPEIVIKNINN